MKKLLPVLLLSLLPSLSFAGGVHAGHDDRKMASLGLPGYSADVSRTIEVVMADNFRFSPSQIKVMQEKRSDFLLKIQVNFCMN